jgi:hypothetical protein
MFQRLQQDRLLRSIVLNVLLALVIVLGPTIGLLGVIAGKSVSFENGAVLVNLRLGTILLFSSLAAFITPFVYRIFLPNNVNIQVP